MPGHRLAVQIGRRKAERTLLLDDSAVARRLLTTSRGGPRAADTDAFEGLFVDVVLDPHCKPPTQITKPATEGTVRIPA